MISPAAEAAAPTRPAAQATFTEVTWDPNPADDWVQAEYEFTLRHADGTVDVIRETHRLGAFSRELWLRLLAETGFDPSADVGGPAMPGQRPDNLFTGVRPADRPAPRPAAAPGRPAVSGQRPRHRPDQPDQPDRPRGGVAALLDRTSPDLMPIIRPL